MGDASAKEKFDIIRENLAEVLNPEIIEKILDEGRHPKIYWGMYIASIFNDYIRVHSLANSQ